MLESAEIALAAGDVDEARRLVASIASPAEALPLLMWLRVRVDERLSRADARRRQLAAALRDSGGELNLNIPAAPREAPLLRVALEPAPPKASRIARDADGNMTGALIGGHPVDVIRDEHGNLVGFEPRQ